MVKEKTATARTVRGLSFPPLAMSISDTAATLGIGRTSVYSAIAQKRLEVRKLGRRTLVLTTSITRLLEEVTDAE